MRLLRSMKQFMFVFPFLLFRPYLRWLTFQAKGTHFKTVLLR